MPISPGIEDNEVTWNWRAGLGDATGISVAQVNGISVPNRGRPELLTKVPLGQFNTLILAAIGAIPPTTVASALVPTIRFG
jgi:hypothetical protein